MAEKAKAAAKTAAKAAAKKAKKQQAKSKKQQSLSNALADASDPKASDSTAGPSSAHPQDSALAAAMQQLGTSAQTEPQSVSAGQNVTSPLNVCGESAAPQPGLHRQEAPAAVLQQAVTANSHVLEGKVTTKGGGQASNAHTLEQLFCCPLTKVCAPTCPLNNGLECT